MNRKIVCRTAGVAAFMVWPLVVLAGLVLGFVLLVTGLDWIGKLFSPAAGIGKGIGVVLLCVVSLCFIFVQGMNAYEWVQKKCSPDDVSATTTTEKTNG